MCIFARFADDELEGEMAGWAGRGDGRAIRAGVVRLRRGGAFRAGAQERGLMVLMACDGSWTQAGRLPGRWTRYSEMDVVRSLPDVASYHRRAE